MAPINVGVIGYGSSAKRYNLPFVVPNPDLKVYAFLQRAAAPTNEEDKQPGKHCTVDFPEAKHYRTPDEFFADSDIELVLVLTHHGTHGEFAAKALRAGKHAVVEKPFTMTSAEADDLIKLQKETGKVLTVYQNRRYDSDFRTLRHLVENSAFGEITDCQIYYDINFPPWATGWKSPDYTPGDGMMFGLGSHSVDQALQLFGRPATVTGLYRSLRGVESKTDDTFTIILQYDGAQKNLIVTIKTTIVSPLPNQLKYFVRGYNGSFTKYGEDQQEPHVLSGMTASSPGFGVEPGDLHGVLTTKEKFHDAQTQDEKSGIWVGRFPSFKGEHTLYYEDVVKAIRGEADLVVKPEQSRDGIRVIELARESADKGCTVAFT